MSIRSARRSSGVIARRSKSAFARSVTTSPATMISTSTSRIGAWIVTGEAISSTAIAPSRLALTAKTRQKSGSRVGSTTRR